MAYFFKYSCENKVPIMIIYLAKDCSFTQRKVLVKKITSDKIIAYCYLRKQIRSFSLDRVLSVGTGSSSNAV